MSYQPYPKNPACGKNNRPRENGQTRVENGQLEYKSPMTKQWEPAVRLHDIRADILRRADPRQYTHAKVHGNSHGNEPTNYTAFLAKDQDVGTDRATRPDVLFQIRNEHPHAARPSRYVMDHGRIILDAFDHGLRHFPELPIVLSSELEGSDIEYYYRQNADIADYDLIARMPNGYAHGKDGKRRHDGPPRVGTINQRAQRFRTKAGCIAWCKREGTRTKNEVILGLIPAHFKDPAINSTKGFRDLTKEEQEIVERKNQGTKPSRSRAKKAQRVEFEDDDGLGDWADFEAEDGGTLATSGTTHEGVNTRQNRAQSKVSLQKPPEQSLLESHTSTINSRDMPSRMTLRSGRPVAHRAPSIGDEDEGTSVERRQHCPVRRVTAHRPIGTKSYPPKAIEHRPHEEVQPLATNRKRRHQTDDNAASEDEDSCRRAGPPREQQLPILNQQLPPLHHRYLTNVRHDPIGPLEATMTQASRQAHNAWTLSDARKRRQRALPKMEFNPDTNEVFQWEADAGLIAGDYRYVAPADHGDREEDKATISRALELTRIQFCGLKGMSVPGDFIEYRSESYASQWYRIQYHFEKVWRGTDKPIRLYRLPRWKWGFDYWTVPRDHELGMSLLKQLEMGEQTLEEIEQEFQNQQSRNTEKAARKQAEGEQEEA